MKPNYLLLSCLLLGAVTVSCNQKAQIPKVAPLLIDIPASYRSDTSVWSFVKNQEAVWTKFGKEVEKLYVKGEKFRKKEFESLSERALVRLLQLDNDYAALWVVQIAYLRQMDLEAEKALSSASKQGAAKITEIQLMILDYYKKLSLAFGQDLKLDKYPLSTPVEVDSLWRAQTDSLLRHTEDRYRAKMDTLSKRLALPPLEEK